MTKSERVLCRVGCGFTLVAPITARSVSATIILATMRRSSTTSRATTSRLCSTTMPSSGMKGAPPSDGGAPSLPKASARPVQWWNECALSFRRHCALRPASVSCSSSFSSVRQASSAHLTRAGMRAMDSSSAASSRSARSSSVSGRPLIMSR